MAGRWVGGDLGAAQRRRDSLDRQRLACSQRCVPSTGRTAPSIIEIRERRAKQRTVRAMRRRLRRCGTGQTCPLRRRSGTARSGAAWTPLGRLLWRHSACRDKSGALRNVRPFLLFGAGVGGCRPPQDVAFRRASAPLRRKSAAEAPCVRRGERLSGVSIQGLRGGAAAIGRNPRRCRARGHASAQSLRIHPSGATVCCLKMLRSVGPTSRHARRSGSRDVRRCSAPETWEVAALIATATCAQRRAKHRETCM